MSDLYFENENVGLAVDQRHCVVSPSGKMDKDKDGHIDLEEFLKFCKQNLA